MVYADGSLTPALSEGIHEFYYYDKNNGGYTGN
jgi:hypothetical protein